MLNTFIALFKNDHIKCGKKQIRAFSPLWWVVRIMQVACCCVGMAALYMALTVLFMV